MPFIKMIEGEDDNRKAQIRNYARPYFILESVSIFIIRFRNLPSRSPLQNTNVRADVRLHGSIWRKQHLNIEHSSSRQSHARDHIQHPADDWEFLTHLWALLSHAGILASEKQSFEEENTATVRAA